MKRYTQTSPSMQRHLRHMWRGGASPVDMIRHLRESGYSSGTVGRALGDAFGVRLIDQRYASGWRADGTGVADEVANRILADSIRNAERSQAVAGEPSIDEEFLEGAQQRAALAVLYSMWNEGALVDMVRWLRACGITGDAIEDAFQRVFALNLLCERFAGGWQVDSAEPTDHVLAGRVSKALADAEAEVIAHPLPEPGPDEDATVEEWIRLAGQGSTPISQRRAQRVLRAMRNSGIAPTQMLDLLFARGLSPADACRVFGDSFALDSRDRELACSWLTHRGDLQNQETNRALATSIEAAAGARKDCP